MSGNAVIFSIDASATSVCSITSGVVTFTGAGSCVIDANQAGNANFNAAAQVQQAVSVVAVLGSQTISFTSIAPTGAVVGGPTYTPMATGGASGNAVIFSIDASATSVCSITSGVVSFTAVGSCVIDANQAGNAEFSPAPQVQQTVPVGKGAQTIVFTSAAPTGAVVGGPTYTPMASGGASGNPVVLSIDASATSVCAISITSGVVSFTAVGSCVIDANQAGNADFSPAPQVQQKFAVVRGAQTIVFTSAAPTGALVGGPTYTPTASGGASGNAVIFSIDASATSVCSITSGVVSFTGAGSCVIDANQAGNVNYNPAAQVQQTVPVGKGAQTIVFTSAAPTGAVVGGPTYTPTASGGASGNPVVLSIDASATSVCAISITSGVVSFTAVGSCVIDANQAGNANYNPAPRVQQKFAVGMGAQTITFTSIAPTAAVVGGPTYTPMASGGASGNPVVLSIDASATSVCSISITSGVVAFTAVGSCVIDANQAGNANYNPAPQVQQTVLVGVGAQTIVFTSAAPTGVVVGGPTYTPTAIGGGSGNPVVLSIDASATSVCAISITSGVVSFTGAGSCVIDANQAGNANFNAADQVQQKFAVDRGAQAITFTSTAPTGRGGGRTHLHADGHRRWVRQPGGVVDRRLGHECLCDLDHKRGGVVHGGGFVCH